MLLYSIQREALDGRLPASREYIEEIAENVALTYISPPG